MAEETHQHDNQGIDTISHDDMSVMRVLMHEVKGLSPISTPPILEPILADD
ncbi:MAG TPA: hypothetical protein VGE34_04390 [Candidatus Saccharimonadales bacterium]